MNEYDADVLIVGAGPTGLALANALGQLSISFVIVEAKSETSIHTKATNLMPGTLEQIDVYGLADAMYAKGGVMERYMVHMYGTNVGPREMHLDESPHPNVLFLGQDLIDRTLKEQLPEGGREIRFGHKLTHLSQDGEGVTAGIETDGQTQTIRTRYVVGCDGPRSITRSFSKNDFEPVKTGKYVWQVDAKLSWRGLRTMKQMWLYYYPEGFGAVIHLPGGLTKVMAFEEKGRLPNRNPTLEEMQERLRMMSGDNTATLTDPVWVSHGELLTGVAPGLVDGRIILAGDASNPILPNGGQGLNVGIQDSLNLAWKLADVVAGRASPDLLDTYEVERRGNRLALEKVQINTLKNTLPAPAFNRFFFRKYGNWFLNKFWPFLAKAFSQLGVAYVKSPLTFEKLGKKGVRAGNRVLDADVLRNSDQSEVSLFKELSKPCWKVVMFDDGGSVSFPSEILDWDIPGLETLIISTSDSKDTSDARAFTDVERIAHKTYQIGQPTVFLIRPDNYIAARVGIKDVDSLKRHVAKFYPNQTVPLSGRADVKAA